VFRLQEGPEWCCSSVRGAGGECFADADGWGAGGVLWGLLQQGGEVGEEGKITYHNLMPFVRHLAGCIGGIGAWGRGSDNDAGFWRGGWDDFGIGGAGDDCGRGGAVSVTVVDYNKSLVVPVDGRITMRRVDTLGEVESVFGFVIASAVIEHYPRPAGLLKELLGRVEGAGCFMRGRRMWRRCSGCWARWG